MKILFINGSPRKNGNSDTLIKELIAHCDQLDIDCSELKIRDKQINSCTGCDTCHSEKRKCSQKDDFSGQIFHMILEVDALYIVSPVYQGGVTGIMKNFMDRCEMFRKGRLLKGKLCGGTAIGGYPGGGQELTLMQIQYFSHICAMRYIASWGKHRSHLGGHCIAFEKQEIKNDAEGIRSSINVLNEMAEVLK
jgi:multimeric flavodoxin WrbA